MSLKFNEAFNKIIEMLPISDDSKDEDEINQKIYQAFHDMNSIFQGTLFDLKKTNLRKPYYHPWIQVKMPFKITPNKVFDGSEGSIFKLKAASNVRHPAVLNGFVEPKLLTALFDIDLKRAIGRVGQVTCQSGKVYTLDVESDVGELAIYNIQATLPPITRNLDYSYIFELGLQFLDDPNIYQPSGTQFYVLRKKPTMLRSHIHVVACEKLMKYLNVERTEDISAYIFPELFINLPLSHAILDTLKYIISVSKKPERLSSIYEKLIQFKQEDSVELSELMALLDLN